MATCCLLAGMFHEFITFKEFFVFNQTLSLIGSIFKLWEFQEYFLFFILFCFSIVFPLLKLLALFAVLNLPFSASIKKTLANVVHTLGKWSMLDVYVAANLVLLLRYGSVGKVEIHGALVFFSIGIILSMVVSYCVQKYLESY